MADTKHPNIDRPADKVDYWISFFGVPATKLANWGTQFELYLCNEIAKFLGARQLQTTACQPQANETVKWLLHTLKMPLMVQQDPHNCTR